MGFEYKPLSINPSPPTTPSFEYKPLTSTTTEDDLNFNALQDAIFQAEGGRNAKTPYGYNPSNPKLYGDNPWQNKTKYDTAVKDLIAREYQNYQRAVRSQQFPKNIPHGSDFITWLARQGYNNNPQEWTGWEQNVRSILSKNMTAAKAVALSKIPQYKPISSVVPSDLSQKPVSASLLDKFLGGFRSITTGFIGGLTGIEGKQNIPKPGEKLTFAGIDWTYDPQQGWIDSKGISAGKYFPGLAKTGPEKPLPEYQTLHGIGEVAGTVYGYSKATKVAEAGRTAITKVFPSLAKLPQTVETLGRFAGAAGLQTAVTHSLNQIYDKGYIDPKQVGEETALSAGLTAAFPAFGLVLGRGLRTLAKLIPGAESIRPLALPGQALNKVADFLGNSSNPVLQNIGTQIDNGLSTVAHWLESPSVRFKELRSEWNLDRLMFHAERDYGRFGRGVESAPFRSTLAEALDKASVALRGTFREAASNLHRAAEAIRGEPALGAGRTGFFSGNQAAIKGIEDAINSGAYHVRITLPGGKTRNVLGREGQFLAFIKEMMILRGQRGGLRPLERLVRSGIAHIDLGFGNVASGITVGLRLNYSLAQEGPEAIAEGVNNLIKNTLLAQKAMKILSREFPGESIGIETRKGIERVSFAFYEGAERILKPVTWMARYTKAIRAGASEKDAVFSALRSTRLAGGFNYDFDLGRIMRNGDKVVGPVVRMFAQFMPFALKSTEFVSSLGIPSFVEYMGYAFASAGLKGVPFVTVADKIWTAFVGTSVINNLYANPKYAKYLQGIPGVAFGVDVGTRHNWSQNLFDRFTSMGHIPSQTYAKSLYDALESFINHPSESNAKRLGEAALPLPWRYAERALKEEQMGVITDYSGRPLVTKPTEEELTARGLGFTPTRLSEISALRTEETSLTQHRNQKVQSLYRELREAYLSKNGDDQRDIIRQLVKLGVAPESIIQQLKQEMLPPKERIIRQAPRTLRQRLREIGR